MKFEVEITNEDALLKQVTADLRDDGFVCDIEAVTDEDICKTLETSIGCFGFSNGDIYIKRIS